MRKLSIAAFVALGLLAGCNHAEPEPSNGRTGQAPANREQRQRNAAANAPIPSTVSGSVTLKDPRQVGQGSKLDIKLVDVAQPDVPVAEKSIDVSGAPPFNFSLDLDPAKIDRKRAYTLNAVLTDGERRFMPALTAPVLTGGSAATVQIMLTPEPTAGEKLKDEFAKLQARIGGMKKVDGVYTTDEASIGWDAFAEHNKVVFVRVNTEYDKGGRTSVKYAFKDDKPMFVKQQGGATIGWDDNGGVDRQREAGRRLAQRQGTRADPRFGDQGVPDGAGKSRRFEEAVTPFRLSRSRERPPAGAGEGRRSGAAHLPLALTIIGLPSPYPLRKRERGPRTAHSTRRGGRRASGAPATAKSPPA